MPWSGMALQDDALSFVIGSMMMMGSDKSKFGMKQVFMHRHAILAGCSHGVNTRDSFSVK
jgi:hypothetical protein